MSGSWRLAAAFSLLLAVSAGAEEGAYLTLVSMGRAAATDRGPDPGAPPTDAARREAPTSSAPSAAAATGGAYAPPAESPLDADVVAAENGAPGRRRWLRAVAVLSPARRRASSFAAPDVSSATARAFRAPPSADAAVRAGARRGLAELLSVCAAPLEP